MKSDQRRRLNRRLNNVLIYLWISAAKAVLCTWCFVLRFFLQRSKFKAQSSRRLLKKSSRKESGRNLECADNGGALDFLAFRYLRIQSGVALRLAPHSKYVFQHPPKPSPWPSPSGRRKRIAAGAPQIGADAAPEERNVYSALQSLDRTSPL